MRPQTASRAAANRAAAKCAADPAEAPALAVLDPSVRAALRAVGRVGTVPRDAVLWHEGMETAPEGMVLEGMLRQQRHGIDGRRQIVNLVLPGEILAAANLARDGYTLEAATPATLLRLRPGALDRLLGECPPLSAFAFRSLQSQLDRLRWLTWTILDLGAEARVCAFLDCALDAMPVAAGRDGPVLTLVLSRRDVADLLSTSVESVCRILKGLERGGLIRMHAPTRLEILAPEALRARGRSPADCPLSPRRVDARLPGIVAPPPGRRPAPPVPEGA